MKIWMIAGNTFREAVRNKIFYTLIFFAVVFAVLSVLLSTMIIGDFAHILIDMGLANIEIFGTLIAIFIGISLVYKELQLRTVYTILSRPIQRYQFILGKYLGLVLMLLVEVLLMCAIFFLILGWFDAGDRIPALLPAIWLIFWKLMIVTAAATLFSSYSTPILSGMFTLSFYVIGSTSSFLDMLMDPAKSPITAQFIRGLSFILPNFHYLDLKAEVVYQLPVSLSFVFNATLYALLYVVCILLLAIQIFDRRDLK